MPLPVVKNMTDLSAPRHELYHCGFVGDIAMGEENLAVLTPRIVPDFPDRQIAQLVPGGWGRAYAVLAGDPASLVIWGIDSRNSATEGTVTYVQGRAQTSTYEMVFRRANMQCVLAVAKALQILSHAVWLSPRNDIELPQGGVIHAEVTEDVQYAAAGWEHILTVNTRGGVQQRSSSQALGSVSQVSQDSGNSKLTQLPSGAGQNAARVVRDISTAEQPVLMVAAGELHRCLLP